MVKKIREVMSSKPISMPATASVQEAAERMRDAGIGDVIVMEGNKVCGIVTDRDLVVRAIAQGRDPHSTTVADVCSRDLATVSPDDQIGSAIRLMRDKAVRRLPVVESGQLVGVLSIGDLAIERDRESALAAISSARPSQ
jgi:signal-transduction protein with cAMP-binding, CBS, and nucleotidyltransferase domain